MSDGGKVHGLNSDSSSSSDDEQNWNREETKKLGQESKESRRKLQEEKRETKFKKPLTQPTNRKPRFYEMKEGAEIGKSGDRNKLKEMKK